MSDTNKNAKKITKSLKNRHEFIDLEADGNENITALQGPSGSIMKGRKGPAHTGLRNLSAATQDLEQETIAASRDMLNFASNRLEASKEAEDLGQLSKMMKESPSEEDQEGDDSNGSNDDGEEENRLAMLELAYARYCVQKRILRDDSNVDVRYTPLDEYEVLDKLKELEASSMAIDLQTQTAEGDSPIDFQGDSFANIIEVVRQSVETGEDMDADALDDAPRPGTATSKERNDNFDYQDYLDAINNAKVHPASKSILKSVKQPFSCAKLQEILQNEEVDVDLAISYSKKFLRPMSKGSSNSMRSQTPGSRPGTPGSRPESPASRPDTADSTYSASEHSKKGTILKPTDLVEPLPELVAEMLNLEEAGTPMTSPPNEIFNKLFPGGVQAAVAETKRDKSKPKLSGGEKIQGTVKFEATVSIRDALRGMSQWAISSDSASQTEMTPDPDMPKKGSDLDMKDFGETVNEDVESLPPHYTMISLRSTVLPKWFPGYLVALPGSDGLSYAPCPSTVLTRAYLAADHKNFDEQSIIIIGD